MKKSIMAIITALASLFGCSSNNESFKSVDVAEFEKVISDGSAIRLDVRTAVENSEGHIEGAINIDVLQDNFEDEALKQLPKGQTIALYCRSGNRSKSAARILSKDGFSVVELSTGYNGWISAGMPVVTRTPRKTI